VKETADLLGITGLLERKPGELAGGERQRVALGRALARRPKLFLLDEPLASLDGPLREQLRGELAQLQRRLGATMIHVTHDQLEAMTLGDRIAVLRAGQLQQVADPLRLYRHPANLFTAGFIGSPAMNFFAGALAAKGPELFFEGAGIGVPVAAGHADQLRHWIGRRVVLGLRPEDISIVRPAEAETAMRARIETVERLGAETLVRFRLDEHRGVLRAGPEEPAAPNQDRALRFRMDQAHFFDPTHGARIG
jgi:multiple sugar transport system ATP-binding protein